MADPWTGGPSLVRTVDPETGSHLRWNVATEGQVDLDTVRHANQETLGDSAVWTVAHVHAWLPDIDAYRDMAQ
eukprot:1479762-Pyramimonas_sp.AAC.1